MDVTAAHLDIEKSEFEKQVKDLAWQYDFSPGDLNVDFGNVRGAEKTAPHIEFMSAQRDLRKIAAFGLHVSQQFGAGLSVGNTGSSYYDYDGTRFTRNKSDVALIQTDENTKKEFFKEIEEANNEQIERYLARLEEIREEERQQELNEQNRQAQEDGFYQRAASHQRMLENSELYDQYGPWGLHNKNDYEPY
ncbi:MAG TPA: hypothetical protein VGF14_04965 [Alphaproteobacteria bacterium]